MAFGLFADLVLSFMPGYFTGVWDVRLDTPV